MTSCAAHNPDRQAGFTLVEVLVSMFIFSLISIGALIALTATLDARERSEARIEQVERLAAARRVMADDFAAMTLRQNRDGLGGFIDLSREAAQTDAFTLTRRARPNPDGAFARGDLLRVSWRVENGQLIRSFLPHENPAYVEPPIDRVVLDGVEKIEVYPIFREVEIRSIVIPDALARANAVSITLIHKDGTTTRHVFELSNA
ncbi:MAG: type II secretion system minor pseudopilin GspJ [Litorimonas sp.]